MRFELPLQLTARQYGEVVLPDAASGQGPGTLASKVSRCQEGMAHCFAVMVQSLVSIRVSRYKFDRSREAITVQEIYGGHWRSVAVQAVSEPENCHGAGFKLRCRCACPGARTITNLSWVQEQKLRSPALRGKLRDEPERSGARRSQTPPCGAKTVTSKLPILSVLGFRCNISRNYLINCP